MNIVRRVEVANFRCHDRFTLELKNPTTLVVGENGSGKTSLIEALYILLRGRSFKSTDVDIIKRGSSLYRVKADFCDGTTRSVSYNSNTNKKEFVVDDKKTARLPAKHKYPVVLFQPDDLNLIHSSPNRRRHFLDETISQFSPSYHQSLLRYDKALRQRNGLLKNEFNTKEQTFPWDMLLAKHGSEIINSRLEYINQVNSRITDLYHSIAENHDQISINYDGKVLNETTYLQALSDSYGRDRIIGFTSVGPHRDDMSVCFNSKPAASTASRGENRSIILALKFIESETTKSRLGVEPVILLDDIFSELDETRQSCLVSNFKKHQVIITATSAPNSLSESAHL